MLIKSIRLLTLVIILFFTLGAFAQSIEMVAPDRDQQTNQASHLSFIDKVYSAINEKSSATDFFYSTSTWFIIFSTLIIILSVINYLSSHRSIRDSRKTAIIFVLLFIISFANIIGWSTFKNIQKFDDYQKQLGTTSVNSAKENIEQYIHQRQESLNTFTHFFKPELLQLLEIPEDDEILERLDFEVATHFPNYFTYNLVNTDGMPLISQQAIKIGPVCRTELNSVFK